MLLLEGVTKKIENKTILEDITLRIQKGEFIVIYGKSGSGKSTLLHLMGGLEKLDDGEIIIAGKSLNTMSTRSKRELRKSTLGFIFQNYALIDNETVEKNLKLVEPDREKIKNILSKVSLSKDIIDQKIVTLSGGEQQRVAIARVLLQNAKIILADEPTGNLDKNNSKEIFELLKSLQEKGKTIICVSHDESIKKYATQVYSLNNRNLIGGRQ